MKNYFQKIITLFTGNDYPESTQQDFYKWLVDEEHTVEKDEALQKLWDDAHKRGTAADMQESYELLKKNAGIPSVPRKRTIRPIHIWQAVAAVLFIVAASSVYLSTIGNDFQVTALGTEFNVSAYPENPVLAATLISGSVLVEYNDLKSQVILKPNEQLAYNKDTRRHCLDNPDMKEVTAWQRGELVFREMSVKDIITVLERKYPYTFEYQLKNLKEDKYSFRFKDRAPLSEVMDIIVSVVGQMDYKIKGDHCYLISK